MLLSIPRSKPCNNHRFPCDNFPEIHPSESGLNTSNRCFQITLSPQVHIILREEEKLLQLLEIYMLSEYILYIFGEWDSLYGIFLWYLLYVLQYIFMSLFMFNRMMRLIIQQLLQVFYFTYHYCFHLSSVWLCPSSVHFRSLDNDTFLLAVQLGLIFSHTEKYPDEPPLLNVTR